MSAAKYTERQFLMFYANVLVANARAQRLSGHREFAARLLNAAGRARRQAIMAERDLFSPTPPTERMRQ